MFDRFVVVADLSAAAYALAKSLGGLYDFGARDCLLLDCLGTVESETLDMGYVRPVFGRIVSELREILEKQGFLTDARIVPDIPKREIFRIAGEEGYSLVVVGAQARTLLTEALMGEAAYEIIRRCTMPVLLVRLAEVKHGGTTSVEPVRADFGQHILFPTDFSVTADLAFETVKKMAVSGARKITLMHVQDKARIFPRQADRLDEFNRIDTDRLTAMKAALREIADVEVDMVLKCGDPSDEIIDTIKNCPVRLVVMGSQGRGFIKDIFIGSVAHNVARHAPASVLLIPAAR